MYENINYLLVLCCTMLLLLLLLLLLHDPSFFVFLFVFCFALFGCIFFL